MAYGIVITVKDKNYLQVTEDFAIQGYKEIEEALATFKGFSQNYFSESYESHISSGMGLLNLRPRIIELPEDPSDLKEYMLQDTVTYLKGMGFGYAVNSSGVEVSKSIEELVGIDVAHEVITKREPI